MAHETHEESWGRSRAGMERARCRFAQDCSALGDSSFFQSLSVSEIKVGQAQERSIISQIPREMKGLQSQS